MLQARIPWEVGGVLIRAQTAKKSIFEAGAVITRYYSIGGNGKNEK
jgi:hypothetical protein